MDGPNSRSTISTVQGLILIALVIAALTALSLWRNYHSQVDELAIDGPDGTAAQVVIFTTRQCPFCLAAKRFLKQHGVAYTELKIDTSPKARQLFDMLRGTGVPLIFVDKIRLAGFDERLLTQVLQAKGLMPAAKRSHL